MDGNQSPTNRSRLLALIGGPCFLLCEAQLLSDVTATPLSFAVVIVIVASIVLMVVLGLLGANNVLRKSSPVRFSLSTAFLFSVPLCIYFALLQAIVRRYSQSNLGFEQWRNIACLAAIWVGITMAVLVALAEAIVWLARIIRRS